MDIYIADLEGYEASGGVAFPYSTLELAKASFQDPSIEWVHNAERKAWEPAPDPDRRFGDLYPVITLSVLDPVEDNDEGE